MEIFRKILSSISIASLLFTQGLIYPIIAYAAITSTFVANETVANVTAGVDTQSAVSATPTPNVEAVAAVAQVNTITIGGTIETGDTFTAHLPGQVDATFTAADINPDSIATGLNNAIQASAGYNSQIFTSEVNSNVITLTASTPGTQFTVTSNASNYSGVAQVDDITPANIEVGDQFTVSGVSDSPVTVTATDTTAATLVDAFVTAINSAAGHTVTASNNSGVLRLTANVAGAAFTATPSTSNKAAVAQINIITISGVVETGDVFTAHLPGADATYSAQMGDNADAVAAGLNTAIQASVGYVGFTSSVTNNVITLTASAPGTGFTVTSDTTDNGSNSTQAATSATPQGNEIAGTDNQTFIDSNITPNTAVGATDTQSAVSATTQSNVEGVVAVAQVNTITVSGTAEAGDVFTAIVPTDGAIDYVVSTDITTDDIASGLNNAILASTSYASQAFTASASGSVITLTAKVAGTGFSVTSGATNRAAVAQVVTFTPANVSAGETFRATINDTDYDYLSLNNSVGTVVGALALSMDANSDVTCSQDSTKVTCIADSPGTVFTYGATVVDETSPDAPSTPILDSASDTGASNSDNITSATTLTLTGMAEDGSMVKIYDTDGTTEIGNGTAVGGNYSVITSALSEGAHSITAKATDEEGNTSVASSILSVTIDITAPVIAAHNDEAAEATSSSGAIVNYASPVTTDNLDADGTAICSPVSGSEFALGDTLVVCDTTDTAGNVATQTGFTVNVADTTAPVITAPADVMGVEAEGMLTVIDIGTATATDLVDGSVTVTNDAPASFPVGTTTVTYTATDTAGNTATATQNVTVQDATAPIIDQPADVNVIATSSLGADVTYTSPITHDIVDGDGTAICLPASGSTFARGATTVTCNATDAQNNSAAPVTFTVNVANSVPTADAESVITDEDTPLDITLSGTDVDGTLASCDVVSGPTNGQLSGVGCNLTYTPNVDYYGSDSFTFTVTDDDGAVSNPATIDITVNNINDAPVANDVADATNEDTAKTITLNATDIENDTLTYSIVSGPSHGTLSNATGNQIDYTPDPDFNGSDSFTYQVNDGALDSNVATVNLTVNPVNDVPSAPTLSAPVDTAQITDATPGFSWNASADIDGDAISYNLLIDDNSDFSSPEVDQITGSTNLTPGTLAVGTYSWKVVANDGTVFVDSAARAFEVLTPITSGNPQIIIDDSGPSIIDLPSDVANPTLDLSGVSSTVGITTTATLNNSITLDANNFDVFIPGGINIQGDNWNGILNAPTQVALSSSLVVLPITPKGWETNFSSAVEIGFWNTPLTFDRGVRLVLAGQAGKLAGYSRNGVFTQITNTCAADNQATGDALTGGECKIDSGSDLVIWTQHFTQFVTYTQTINPSQDGGGAGNAGPAGAPSCSDQKPGSAPTLLSAKVNGVNSVTLTWSKAADPVTYYLLTFGLAPGLQQYGNPYVGGASDTSYTVNGLSGSQNYYFRLRAGNGCTPGEFSNEISIRPSGASLATTPSGFAAGVLGAKAKATVKGTITEPSSVPEIQGQPTYEPLVSPQSGSLISAIFNAIGAFFAKIFGK